MEVVRKLSTNSIPAHLYFVGLIWSLPAGINVYSKG